jgi:hypothetical protein
MRSIIYTFDNIDVMSSFMRRRDVFTKMRTTLKEFFLKSRKEHIINEINNFLRDKLIDEIDVFRSLSLFQRVSVLLSTLTVKKQILLTLKKMNIKLNNQCNQKNIHIRIFIRIIRI